MKIDILFINCYSYEFFYIPLGTLGLADYLSKYDINSRILNLSILNNGDPREELIQQIERLKPRYIGLILHWKELLTNFIQTGSEIKRSFPDIKIVAGGITASYYAIELVEKFDFLDCIITGDSEEPLRKLLQIPAVPFDEIENVVYRNARGKVLASRARSLTKSDDLDSISFGRLDYILDHEKYLHQINQRLGFPISVGRGCCYDCQACGGSRTAFATHSHQNRMILRRTENVIGDMLRLYQDYGVDFFLLSHLNQTVLRILKAISKEPILKGKITVNLESWELPDEEIFRMYRAACRFEADRQSYFLISPETTIDEDRKRIKDPRHYYSNQQLSDVVNHALNLLDHVVIDVFYSYPNENHQSLEKLDLERKNIFLARKKYSKEDRVHFHFMTLSSDPGSLLNEGNQSIESNLSLKNINHSILFDRKLSSNLLLHRPKFLSKKDLSCFERINHFEELFNDTAPLVYLGIGTLLGYEKFSATLKRASSNYYYDVNDEYYELTNTNSALILNLVKREMENVDTEYQELIRQILDLFILFDIWKRLDRVNIFDRGKKQVPGYLTLNQDACYMSGYNLLQLLMELQDHQGHPRDIVKRNLTDSKVFFLFSHCKIIPMEMAEYELLGQFDGINRVEDIVTHLSAVKQVSKEIVWKRIYELYQEGILI